MNYTCISAREDMCDFLINSKDEDEFLNKAEQWMQLRNENNPYPSSNFFRLNILESYKRVNWQFTSKGRDRLSKIKLWE